VNNKPISRAVLASIFVCFFLSGAAGLIYQVAWSKALGLVFGHTVYAVATVLAVFMGGLALGSAVLGRWCERSSNPVALYGWVELGVAATGALSLAGLAGVRAAYVWAYPAVERFGAGLLALRFAGAALVLFLPTFLMGGTLPILVRGVARRSAELAPRLSRLYWVNTLGAVAGTVAAGFVLLPTLGLRLTVGAAVALNIVAGLAALLLAQGRGEMAAATVRPVEEKSEVPSRLLLTAFAVVGATAMAYEVAWTRLLATILGSSTYAFTLMLATFLAGMVLGSQMFEWWAGRRAVRMETFAGTQTLTAVAALGFLIFFEQLPRVVPPILQHSGESFAGLVLAQFVTSALAMLPAAVVFGFNFPAVVLLIAGKDDSSAGHAARVGRACAANTLGAICGATLAGFVLVPRLGAYRVVAVAAAANLLLAMVFALRGATREGQPTAQRGVALGANLAAIFALGVVSFSGLFYNRALATFGTVLYWNLYDGKLTLEETADTTDILFAADGLNASIAVARTEDYLALRTNGKVDASNRDRGTQLMAGHLGAMFHGEPRRVLVIGFGSGMTVSAVAQYPEVERIDCVEIEAAVLAAARYLEPLNRGVLRDGRLKVHIDDARNFLLTTRAKYDLIVSEPSNPWIAGVASLFTDEFYRAARTRLAPGGMFVQWVQAYSLDAEALRTVLATFVGHFPQATLWHGDEPDLLLLGQTQTEPLGLERLRRLWLNPALREDYQAVGMKRPEGALAFYWLDDAELRRLASGAVRNTDDRTLLEYRAPRSLLEKTLMDKNLELLAKYRSDLLPRDVKTPERNLALLGVAETLLNQEDQTEAAGRYLAALEGAPPTADLELARGRWHLAGHRLVEAGAALERALRLDPSLLEAAVELAKVSRRRGDEESAELLLRQVVAREPASKKALEALANLERDRKNWATALDWQKKRMAADGEPDAEQYTRLGEILVLSGETLGAQEAFQKALQRDAYSFSAHNNLGRIYGDLKIWEEARRHLEFVVRYFPDYEANAYLRLADLYRQNGETSAAERTLAKGRRMFPKDTNLMRVTANE